MRNITSIAWLTLLTLLFPGASLAATDREKLIERGRISFLIYCSNCHGQDASGHGPVAHLLKEPPCDLTLIMKKEMKEFPFEEVYLNSIDGRKDAKSHVNKQMPVWGDAFGKKRATKINELVHYLETIQKTPSSLETNKGIQCAKRETNKDSHKNN